MEIARCRMMVAVREGFDYGHAVQQGARLRVATKYPHIAREHFSRKGVHVDIIKLYGEPVHDFSYTFTPERTRFLHYRLRQDYLSDADLLTLVRKLFGGPDGEKKLRQYCRSHNIPFEFHDSVESIDQMF